MSEIRVNNLTKQFVGRSNSVFAIDDVSFTVNSGEMLVLLGPSGCGKTTTLRCLAGLERPTSGSLSFGDRMVFDKDKRVNVPANRRDIGLVFQTFALWPHLTAAKNIDFPLGGKKMSRSQRADAVANVARMVDLSEDLLVKRPAALSGGQQQRVALARALVAEPDVVFFDEPLSNLDALLREQLRLELRTLHRRIGFTGVYVTHDLVEAATIGDRVAVMRAGRLEQLGTPDEVFNTPKSPAVGRLLGLRKLCTLSSSGSVWECSSTAGSPIGVLAPQAQTNAANGVHLYARPDRLGVRPHGVDADAGSLVLTRAEVVEQIPVGATTELIVRVGDERIRINQVSTEVWAAGDLVDLVVDWRNATFFGDDEESIPAADLFLLHSTNGVAERVLAKP